VEVNTSRSYHNINNSSMLIEFRSDLSSSADILGLNLIGRDLSIL
jgi:hypothetical protein